MSMIGGPATNGSAQAPARAQTRPVTEPAAAGHPEQHDPQHGQDGDGGDPEAAR